jgi:hypothetical protein
MPKSRVAKAAKEVQDSDHNPNYIGVIRGESRIQWGVMSEREEKEYLRKSSRSDYARVVDIRVPLGYHAQVKKSWEMYEIDRTFRYLIDRCEDFAANGFEWEIPVEQKMNWLVWLKQKLTNEETKEEKEHKFWNSWAATINKNVANVLPGIDEINKWIVKHFMLGCMAPLQWEWGTIEVDKEEYEVPVRMTIHNPLSIALDREQGVFTKEEMYLKLPLGKRKISETTKEVPVGLGAFITKGQDWLPIPIMGTVEDAHTEGFALKYKWSPGDNTALVYGRNVHVGQGLYPTPPFVGLFEILVLRRALIAADLAILDGVINFILDWEIGDATVLKDRSGKETMPNQPRPAKYDANGAKIEKSSIEMAKEIITSDTRGNVMQLFHPYYYKLNIKMPDTAVLLNATKYIQSTVELYEAFGILMSPSDKRMDFSGINTQNFEQMLDNLRLFHIRRFWEALATEMVKRNKDKLSVVPNMIFKPLNTKTESFLNGLLSLINRGKISWETLLQGYGLDKKVEAQRIAKELKSGEKALADAQVPVSFVQAKVKPAKVQGAAPIEEIEEEEPLSPLDQAGRPQK